MPQIKLWETPETFIEFGNDGEIDEEPWDTEEEWDEW
jgi:hypothetical protein